MWRWSSYVALEHDFHSGCQLPLRQWLIIRLYLPPKKDIFPRIGWQKDITDNAASTSSRDFQVYNAHLLSSSIPKQPLHSSNAFSSRSYLFSPSLAVLPRLVVSPSPVLFVTQTRRVYCSSKESVPCLMVV